VPPNWFRRKPDLGNSGFLVEEVSRVEHIVRKNSYADPCNLLVPDLVTRLMTEPVLRPVLGRKVLVWTSNS